MNTDAILALVGATATGKTDLAERVADRLDVEIVCADSRQVFRELEVGTGKPSPETRLARPHLLFDSWSITERVSAGEYARRAASVIEAIRGRGRRPLLVGGAGLYLRALREGLSREPSLDPSERKRFRESLAGRPVEELRSRLASRDPEGAARLRPGDRQRLQRALEVVELSGRPLGWWHAQPARRPIEGDWRVIELRVAGAELTRRIEQRTREMFAGGLIEETQAIASTGLRDSLLRLRAVGYDEALDLLEGRLTREQAETRTTLRTRQMAKRQRTWFRHQLDSRALEGAGSTLDSLAGLAIRGFESAGASAG